MWRGNDLLPVIDLVFLNSLAYYMGKHQPTRENRTADRRPTNFVRLFGAGIKKVIDSHIIGRQCGLGTTTTTMHADKKR
jgi:hypothetical protein